MKVLGLNLSVKKVLAFLLSSYGKEKFEKVPDMVPVKDSYLFSGCLDSKQYNYFLNGILKDQFDARRSLLEKVLHSREDLFFYLEKIKSEYLKLLGPLPDRTPLNPIVKGIINKSNYSIEKVAFESRPNHHVTALLYVPEGKGPFPAILNIPGHATNSKSDKTYQRIGRYFALNGFVVLQIDPVCQGERSQICQDVQTKYFDNRWNPMSQCTTGQHDLYNKGLQLLGSGIVAWEAWDNIRSIDYLITRPEVDLTKIGVTGFSGGGTQTTYLVSLDPRIKAASPICYIATTEDKFNTIGSQDSCQQLYSEGKYGIEEQDFLFMAAPLPILILSTYNDFFSYKGSRIATDELLEMYRVLGLEGRVQQFSSPGAHVMPDISIEANIKWMKLWLNGDSSGIIHDTSISDYEPLEDTLVTATGSVFTYFKNEKSIIDFSTEMLEQCKEERGKFLSDCTYLKLVNKVSELIGYENIDNLNGGSYKGSFKWKGLNIDKHLMNRDRGFRLPALIIKPEMNFKTVASVLILAGCFGKMNELSSNIQLVQEKMRKGYVIMVVDVTNTGELRSNMRVAGSGVDYEFAIAKMCLYAGKTLLGYRAEDIIIARNYLKTIIDIKNFELLASEQIGPCAIHAAFINGGFSKLYLYNSLDSWESIVKTHFKPDNIGITVPNVLRHYDLPDLIKRMTKTSVKNVKIAFK